MRDETRPGAASGGAPGPQTRGAETRRRPPGIAPILGALGGLAVLGLLGLVATRRLRRPRAPGTPRSRTAAGGPPATDRHRQGGAGAGSEAPAADLALAERYDRYAG